ncbi:hypothetical protein [Mycobacteroides chelonae]|uniref:hypothetical protein n=1 Tax=Mycobacteroides chelonae TaxID=1774 RepID=UPI000992937F|nr:hypothetical protein [Mycobacteroides chelonae]GLE59675.1 hypothetical protein NJBCHELONAE_49890 [Mycobacteroides chelonae]
MKKLGAIAISVFLLAGCSPEKPQESPRRINPDQTTVRWIPNPAVDLMSPEGTFIRAAAESWYQVWNSRREGVEAIREYTYPGFEHAFNNSRESAVGGVNITRPIIGTEYFEVVNFHREGDHFIVDVCRYGSQTASQTDDGKYSSDGAGNYVHGGDSFTFGPDPTLRPAQQHAPPARQKGSANRPTDNVFGTWVLTEIGIRKSMDTAARNDFAARCNRPAPGTPDNLPNPYVRAEPPPTLPPEPGWPDAGSA